MEISQVYGKLGRLAARGFEIVQARPLSSLMVLVGCIQGVKAAFSEKIKDKLDWKDLPLILLSLEKIEPFLVQKQLYKYPASTFLGGLACLCIFEVVHLKSEAVQTKKKQATFDLSVFVPCLLLGVGIRYYGSSLFTSRYLTWVR